MSHSSLDVSRSLGCTHESHRVTVTARTSVGDTWVGGSHLGGVRLGLNLT